MSMNVATSEKSEMADLIEGEMEYILRHHAEELADALYAAGYRKQATA